MQRKFRLTRSEEFKRVRQSGKSYAHPLIVLVVRANEADGLHVGIAAGRTVGGAVKRNRAKRLLREAMRPLLPSIAPGRDLVLIARPALAASTLTEARHALQIVLKQAELIPAGDAV